jgi:prophage antirepressor-like protein
MYEHNDRTRLPERGAIEISDFVYATTGVRLRRLTTPDGEHWFPAVDVCKHLGYAHTGSTLRNLVDPTFQSPTGSVLQRHTSSIPAGQNWRRNMNLVNLHGLIQLVNGSTKPESQPFKAWVSEVIVTIQRDGTYSLDPAPLPTAPGTPRPRRLPSGGRRGPDRPHARPRPRLRTHADQAGLCTAERQRGGRGTRLRAPVAEETR